MLNRFNNCKSLEDLYKVFEEHADKVLEFKNLTTEELSTVESVFNANVEDRDTVDNDINESGYTYIWNYVVSIVEGREEIEMEEIIMPTINNATTSQEDTNMEEKKVEKAVEELMSKLQEAKENIKVQAGETKEEFIEKTDESLNIMKEALGNTLGVIDSILGCSLIKDSILDMIDASMDGASSRKDLSKMARKCREIIDREIRNLNFWGDEESFRKAVQLKALTEDERGKCIFESFAVGVIWIAKKVFRKLNIQSDSDKKGVFASICRGIGTFAKVLRAGVQIAWNAVKFAASFVVAGIVIAADWLYHAIKKAVEKIKDWSKEKLQKVKEDTEEEDFEDETGDGVFGTNLA